jgi:lysosomal acid lipase/cholesteryl ester hydrolase
MKIWIILIVTLLTLQPSMANNENQVEFFFNGLRYCIDALIYDVFHWSEPATPDAFKTSAELIMTAGYKFETHKIVTEDQYINTAWRIVGKLNDKKEGIYSPPEKKPCVILQHGLLDNSATWLIPNSSEAFPFMLVDEGYDVWMTNSRGNVNSYEHMNSSVYNALDPGSKYFDFTWDEMGKYDVPANLDYILDHSEHDKVFYVGHSQGTTQFFVASDIVEDFGDKIAGFIGIGPVMYIGNMYSPYLRLLIRLGIFDILEFFNFKNFLLLPRFFNPTIRFIAIRLRHLVWRVIGLICGKPLILFIYSLILIV